MLLTFRIEELSLTMNVVPSGRLDRFRTLGCLEPSGSWTWQGCPSPVEILAMTNLDSSQGHDGSLSWGTVCVLSERKGNWEGVFQGLLRTSSLWNNNYTHQTCYKQERKRHQCPQSLQRGVRLSIAFLFFGHFLLQWIQWPSYQFLSF